ncbi:MAG: hypothetical protein R3E83_00405 [Burkholderiaceae bacterium]
MNRQIRHPFVVTHLMAQILDELCRELRDADIVELGQSTVDGCRSWCGPWNSSGNSTTVDDQHTASEIRIRSQEPGACRPHDRAADDDDIIGAAIGGAERNPLMFSVSSTVVWSRLDTL